MKTTASARTSQNNSRPNKLYLALGSNLGDRDAWLDSAERLISMRIGPIRAKSSRLQNVAEGFVSVNEFLNEVIEVDTYLSPLEVLYASNEIERELGRTVKSVDCNYHDRTIDIDMIYYADVVCSTPELTLPHPRMVERRFVLSPLCEIAPDFVHPVLNLTNARMFEMLVNDSC